MNVVSNNKTCRLIFAGDLLPADREYTTGIGVGTTLDRGEAPWSSEIRDLFRQGDVALINLEAPIVEDHENAGRDAFAGRKMVLDYLSDSGVTHAHIANNHILEHGEQHFHQTISLLNQAGIEAVGVQEGGKCKVNVIEINGVSIAIAGFNAIHDIPDQEGCYAALTGDAVMAALCSPAMRNADIRLLSFHWGNEYVHIPSWNQIQLARKAIDAGAHIIMGHHPHVIQPVEAYKHGLICYSLGNFLFDMMWNRAVSTGLIVGVTIERNAGMSWKVHATRIHAHGPVSLLNQGGVASRLKKYKQRMETLLEKGETAYEKIYLRHVKFNRFMARLQMKRQLLMQLPVIPRKYRTRIVRSLFCKAIPSFGK